MFDHLNLNFWTISYSDCQNLMWRLGVVWFSERNCSPKSRLKLIFFKNICPLHTRKCQFNRGQSSIRCRRVMSRYRGKWRRERGLVHVYGKLKLSVKSWREVTSLQSRGQILGNCSHISDFHSHLGDGECLELAEVSFVASKVEPSLWLNQVLDLILVSCSCHRGYSCV